MLNKCNTGPVSVIKSKDYKYISENPPPPAQPSLTMETKTSEDKCKKDKTFLRFKKEK
jgi:hypothetical protein